MLLVLGVAESTSSGGCACKCFTILGCLVSTSFSRLLTIVSKFGRFIGLVLSMDWVDGEEGDFHTHIVCSNCGFIT